MPNPNPAWEFRQAPYNGPFDIAAQLLRNITAAPVEGLWVDSAFAKVQSIETAGNASAFNIDLYGSNAPAMPLNQYTATVGGSATSTDVLNLAFANGNLPLGTKTVSYTVRGGDTLNSIAAALAAAINADTDLGPLGITAAAASAVVTVSYPSVPPNAVPPTPSIPPPSNATALTSSLSGGATETLTIAAGTNGTKLVSLSAPLGFTQLGLLPRWVTARLTSMTGTIISANWHGAA